MPGTEARPMVRAPGRAAAAPATRLPRALCRRGGHGRRLAGVRVARGRLTSLPAGVRLQQPVLERAYPRAVDDLVPAAVAQERLALLAEVEPWDLYREPT